MNKKDIIDAIINYDDGFKEMSYLRKNYLNDGYEYIDHILSGEKVRDLLLKLNSTHSSEKLYNMVVKKIDAIENYKVSGNKANVFMGEIVLLLISSVDKTLIEDLIHCYKEKNR